jgi:hypothetical protein
VWNFGSVAALGEQHLNHPRGNAMLSTVLIVILILALIGALPHWGYSRNWGYGPGGGLGLVLLILVILALTNHI